MIEWLNVCVDMNDPSNLALRDDLVRFQADRSRFEFRLVISNADKSRQRTLQSLAHSLDLNYEYSLALHEVRITRSEALLDDNSPEQTDIRPTVHQGDSIDELLFWPNCFDTAMFNEQLPPAIAQADDSLTSSNFETWDLIDGHTIAPESNEWDLSFNHNQATVELVPNWSSQELLKAPVIAPESLGDSIEPFFDPNSNVDRSAGGPSTVPDSGPLKGLKSPTGAKLHLEMEKEQEEVVSQQVAVTRKCYK
jgi:hypothetical protein